MAAVKDNVPAFDAFEQWLTKNASKIKAPSGYTTVFYHGSKRDVNNWKRVESFQQEYMKRNHLQFKFVMLSDILKDLKPGPMDVFDSMADFAFNAYKMGLISAKQDEVMWEKLSDALSKNTADEIFVWDGTSLKRNTILQKIEIVNLLKNTKLSAESKKKVKKFVEKMNATKQELAQIDKDFSKVYDILKNRRKLAMSYGWADKVSEYWN